MRLFLLPLMALLLAAPESLPKGCERWSAADLAAAGRDLARSLNEHRAAAKVLANYGSDSLMIVHREADGEAELHESQNDVFVVQSGEGTLILGGEIHDAKATSPGEVRGTRIEGGSRVPLRPGDMLHIPPRVPHQVLVPRGRQITYALVKVKEA